MPEAERTGREGHRGMIPRCLLPPELPMPNDLILPSSASLARRIRDNRRFHKYERLLRRIRLRLFDYEDAGKLAKAERVIARIKAICGPTWERRAKRLQEERLSQLRWR